MLLNRIIPKSETNIEKLLENALIRVGYSPKKDFTPQYSTRTGFILDFAFPKQKLAIEADGFKWHSEPKRKRKDAFRQKILEKGGWKVIHFTETQICHNPLECAEKIKQKLEISQ